MGWNMSNILVNEAIANKKSGGGGSSLDTRVATLETSVSALETEVSGLDPNVYSTTEEKIGKWGNDDLYRLKIDVSALPNNTTLLVGDALTNCVIRKLYGTAHSTEYDLPIPYPAGTNTFIIELYFDKTSNKVAIATKTDRTGYTAEIIVEYTKNSVQDTRKKGGKK